MLLSSSLFILLLIQTGLPIQELPSCDSLRANSLIYSGTEYTKSYTEETGDPFLPMDSTVGSIKSNGNWYHFQEFYYDCEDDVLVLKDREGYFRIQLIREKTESFKLNGHLFIKLKLQTEIGEFYEQAYKGKTSLLVRWKKSKETNNDAQTKYKLTRQIFVLQKGKLTEIKKEKDFFTWLGNEAKPTRQWLKKQGINLKKDLLAGIKSTLEHSESNGW